MNGILVGVLSLLQLRLDLGLLHARFIKLFDLGVELVDQVGIFALGVLVLLLVSSSCFCNCTYLSRISVNGSPVPLL